MILPQGRHLFSQVVALFAFIYLLPRKMDNEHKPVIGERIFPTIETEIRQSSDRKRFTVVVSTGKLDRHGTEIDTAGIDFKDYMRNPVVLYNHNYDRIIGRCVGLEVKGRKLFAQMEFNDKNEFALEKKQEVEDSFLNGASIGFMVKEWTYDEDRNVFKIMESELLEFSLVSVPSNRESLILSRDAGELSLLRSEIAELRKVITQKDFTVTQKDLDFTITGSLDPAALMERDAADAAESSAEEAIQDASPQDAEPAAEPSAEAELSAPEPEPAKQEKAQPKPKPRGMSLDDAIKWIDDRLDRKLGRK